MSPENLNSYDQVSLAPAYDAVRIFGPGLLALVLTLGFMPPYIGWLKKFNIDQQLREEGPKSHAHKAKTPTMGGLCFIITTALAVAIGFWLFPAQRITSPNWLVLGVGCLCGLVGFVDDSAKVLQRANKGISAKARLAAESLFGAALGCVLAAVTPQFLVLPHGLASMLGLIPAATAQIEAASAAQSAFWFVPVSLLGSAFIGWFLVTATTNAANLHDGMDGLAAGTSIQIFATLAVMLIGLNQFGLATISATAAFAILGFLAFNKNPAKIFMGDTGSLFIGGLMATLVTAGGLTLYFVPLSAIYIAESVSVMAQVTYFKLTKPYKPEKPMSLPALVFLKLTKRLPGEGKRLLKMAPLHHHFEAVLTPQGWAEWQVVAAFWACQSLLCLVTLLLFLGLK